MANQGYKKRDLQRTVQKVHIGSSVSSRALDGTETTDVVELGFAAEKVTLVTTGDLTATVTPKIGSADSNAGINVTTVASTTITTNMCSRLEIVRTGGSGQVLILAK